MAEVEVIKASEGRVMRTKNRKYIGDGLKLERKLQHMSESVRMMWSSYKAFNHKKITIGRRYQKIPMIIGIFFDLFSRKIVD